MTTSATAPVTGRARPAPRGRKVGLALGLLCLAQLMLVLDVTVVNVALPDIGTGLGLGRDALTWVLTTYTMVFGGLMLLGGRWLISLAPAACCSPAWSSSPPRPRSAGWR